MEAICKWSIHGKITSLFNKKLGRLYQAHRFHIIFKNEQTYESQVLKIAPSIYFLQWKSIKIVHLFPNITYYNIHRSS